MAKAPEKYERFVRQPYKYDTDETSRVTGLFCNDPSRAVQSEKADADINVLVKKFGITGHMPVLNRIPIQADFVPTMSYQEALLALQAADETFMELPAELRGRFDHDPARFVEFCSDEKNRPELEKLGLVVKKAEVFKPLDETVKEGPVT